MYNRAQQSFVGGQGIEVHSARKNEVHSVQYGQLSLQFIVQNLENRQLSLQYGHTATTIHNTTLQFTTQHCITIQNQTLNNLRQTLQPEEPSGQSTMQQPEEPQGRAPRSNQKSTTATRRAPRSNQKSITQQSAHSPPRSTSTRTGG
jgi:hypothetical protein